MLVIIENLGIIEHAELDLSKELILLCGQNNTGKSFLAYGIYHFLTLNNDYSLLNLTAFPSVLVSHFEEKIKSIASDNTITINLTKFLAHFSIQEIFNTLIAKRYLATLDDFFAFPDTHSFSNTKIFLNFADEEVKKRILATTCKKSFYHFHGQKLTKSSVSVSKYKQSMNLFFKFEVAINQLAVSELENLKRILLRKTLSILFDILFNFNAYIAPAERSAINIFSKELSLSKNKVLAQLLRSSQPQAQEIRHLLQDHLKHYSQPIRDNLEIASNLVSLRKVTSEFSYLADELEQSILKGKIHISSEGEVNYFPDNAPGQNLGVHLTASLVKSLANLVFYFRHLAKAGDHIIIDEPELNLHPDNQTLIARFIGRLVNEGFKIITSTHSNYIVREINNLIMLGQAQDDDKTAGLLKKYGYTLNQLIKPRCVGGYLFKNDTRIPQPIAVTEMGLGIETIDQVITELNESSQEIYSSLFDVE
jgi:predicted ATPase